MLIFSHYVILFQLPGVSWSHMNDGDVFIIDARTIIFVWTGRYANHVEKIQVRQPIDLVQVIK